METYTTTPAFSSLSDWSVQHIRDIFEARNDESALRAVAMTFSENVAASLNGTALTRDSICQLVLAMRRGSSTGLKVHWQQAVEVPTDPLTNRVGPVHREINIADANNPML